MTSQHTTKQKADPGRAMKGGSKAVDAPDFAAHTATVKELWSLDRERAAALIKLAEWALKEEQAKANGVTPEGGQR